MMDNVRSFFAPNKLVLAIVMFVLFGVGLTIRLYDLTDLPLDFHPTRQLHSLTMARGWYYNEAQGVPEWQREMAVRNGNAIEVIEPPIIEWLTATTWHLAGQEILWAPRLYSILFWILGSAALFFAALELAGFDGASLALAYMLILPYGAYASRAYQPDPLMVCLLCFTIWALLRWQRQKSWKWAILAGVMGGLTILSKVLTGFFIGGAWLGLILAGIGLRQAFRNRQIWVAGALTVVPYLIYHILGMYILGFLKGQYDARFFPSLWIDPVFYLRWKGIIASTVGFEWFVMGVLGVLTLKDKPHRGLFLGMWVAYVLYGLFVPYHITTHDYYQEPIIPLVALGLAAGAELLLRSLRGSKWVLYMIVYALVLALVVTNAWDVRVRLKANDYRSEAVFWQQLGDKIGHNRSIIGLTQDYGYRLSYWGWVNSTEWLSSSDFNYRELSGVEYDMKALFDEEIQGKEFFVVTMLGELDRQPALKSLLNKGYPIYAQGDGYIIYDLRSPLR
jgi:4-amino-4-deoxy-L-arabinose transferase-like glycosyltransferase